MANTRICSIPDCDNTHKGHGYCATHLRRLRLYGSPIEGILPVGYKLPNGSHQVWLQENLSYNSQECLHWPFRSTGKGYGRTTFDGRCMSASRAMCIMAHGEPPALGLEAAHSCGNRLCVNPAHLRWATGSENQDDRVLHGTSNRGRRNPMARLSEDDVAAIRRKLGTASQTSIAKEYGVSEATISYIASGRRWRHTTSAE